MLSRKGNLRNCQYRKLGLNFVDLKGIKVHGRFCTACFSVFLETLESFGKWYLSDSLGLDDHFGHGIFNKIVSLI